MYEESIERRGERMSLNTLIVYIELSSLSHILPYNPLDRRSGSMS